MAKPHPGCWSKERTYYTCAECVKENYNGSEMSTDMYNRVGRFEIQASVEAKNR